MRVLVAGATGGLGRRLVPALVEAGHEVVGTTRSPGKIDRLEQSGARGIVVDGLDRDAVHRAVATVSPDVVIHQLTALASMRSLRHFDRQFEQTNSLRTTGVDILLDAARASGARRFIAQSFTGWTNPRTGSAVKTEDDPLDPHPVPDSARTLTAIAYLEDAVTSAEGIEGLALRYGGFYGPGNALGRGGEILAMVDKRRFPIVGDGSGVWSMIHIDDAARATTLAVDRGRRGV
jgi:nucleoside-diphosphate-sugar epimerase